MKAPRLWLVLDAGRTVFNTVLKRRVPADATSTTGIAREGPLHVSRELAARFSSFVGWTGDGLAPTFPYALLTHLHFSLVNDARFPFPPLGLIHKKETIELLAPLEPGVWTMRCVLTSINEVERGFELTITSELSVDGAPTWKSTTLAFKRTKSSSAGNSKPRPPPPSLQGAERWALPDGHGRAYAALSNNVDPIHMSGWSARLMGHRGALMHGMWLAARGWSTLGATPKAVEFRFLSPVYLPATVSFQPTADGFGLYSDDGAQTHLLARVTG
ncbi:MAG: MaoC/PaaZ C-terminal domain-containing protein [Myxococcales bacterium]|nr:MaoC/PaaZ C-terminal domain-containing protein [Myxococcales bacterium]